MHKKELIKISSTDIKKEYFRPTAPAVLKDAESYFNLNENWWTAIRMAATATPKDNVYKILLVLYMWQMSRAQICG